MPMRVNSEHRQVVAISAYAVSSDQDAELVTYSLGSCLGVTIHDPVAMVGGLLHSMLPLSKIDTEKAAANPAMFVDSGLVLLLDELFKLGATRDNMTIKMAGCGAPVDTKGIFRIGERNHKVARKVLWKNQLIATAEEIGGSKPRTLTLLMSTGKTTVRGPDGESEL